jgi:hypothetical protein
MQKILAFVFISTGLLAGCATQDMKQAIADYPEIIGKGEIISSSKSMGAQKVLVRYNQKMYTCYVPSIIAGEGWCIE